MNARSLFRIVAVLAALLVSSPHEVASHEVAPAQQSDQSALARRGTIPRISLVMFRTAETQALIAGAAPAWLKPGKGVPARPWTHVQTSSPRHKVVQEFVFKELRALDEFANPEKYKSDGKPAVRVLPALVGPSYGITAKAVF